MKRPSLHRKAKHDSHKSALAASFVVTFAAQGAGGCKKQPIDLPEPEDTKSSTSIYRDPYGDCRLAHHVPCPKDVSCNPPAPMLIDCPPDMRDAGDAPAVTRRPSGKEDWLRVTPLLWSTTGTSCTYQPEYFCSPPGKRYECTPRPKSVTVACTMGDAGTRQVGSFIYEDGLGVCRKVPASECKPTSRNTCDLPEGEVVPCP